MLYTLKKKVAGVISMPDEFLKTLTSLIGISTLAAAARSVLSEDRRSLKGFFRAVVLAIFVGGITGGLVSNYNFSPAMQGSIVGLCSFVADDILLGVISLVAWFKADPSRIINVIFNRRPPE